MRNTNRWLKLTGLMLSGGLVFQLWGGCGTLLPQIGYGAGFSLGAIPAEAVGCLIIEGTGQTCEGAVVPGAIILGD